MIREGSDPNYGHKKALGQAVNRLNNAIDDVSNKCGKFIGECAAIGTAIEAGLEAAAAVAEAAAPFLPLLAV